MMYHRYLIFYVGLKMVKYLNAINTQINVWDKLNRVTVHDKSNFILLPVKVNTYCWCLINLLKRDYA